MCLPCGVIIQALLEKRLWRYGHKVTHLWRRVISTKYGEGKGVGGGGGDTKASASGICLL